MHVFVLLVLSVVVSSNPLGKPEIPQTKNVDLYRLNKNVSPESYNVTLKLEEDFGETQIFEGNVTIRLNILEDLSFIQLHSKYLTIPEDGVELLCGSSTENLLFGLEFGEQYEMAYVRSQQVLQSGSACTLSFYNFRGTLADDMYGLYRSYYFDEDNQRVYLFKLNHGNRRTGNPTRCTTETAKAGSQMCIPRKEAASAF